MLLLKSFGILVKHTRGGVILDGCWDDLSKSFGILIEYPGEGNIPGRAAEQILRFT